MVKRITLTSMAFAAILSGGVALGALGSGMGGLKLADAQPITVEAPSWRAH